jgi:hypothetical protein
MGFPFEMRKTAGIYDGRWMRKGRSAYLAARMAQAQLQQITILNLPGLAQGCQRFEDFCYARADGRLETC